ncbi:hypothetical protein [Aureliella helgolandensis]|uniref:Arrestin-like N-terminal domain-containing protein n=1 Tax=Aureliella helgolandensis TaxID=2527968 RepID=A0A518GG74_9BACT|nr:hypothetical protein [Aureliella helgolandensis]QDV27599.1 hypothetical protein Q31a_59910 [Aureliella helgolandensis]
MAIVLPKFSSRRVPARRGVTARTEPAIGLRFTSLQHVLEPGEVLELEYRIQRVSVHLIDRLELSVLWYTEGKGSEDIGVHRFESVSREQLSRGALEEPRHVRTTLPCSPLSYEGRLLKIRWCVRLRLYLTDGREISAKQPFYLGHLTVEV